MAKSTYQTPSAQSIEFCAKSTLLALSDPTKNPYYSLEWGEEDQEFI